MTAGSYVPSTKKKKSFSHSIFSQKKSVLTFSTSFPASIFFSLLAFLTAFFFVFTCPPTLTSLSSWFFHPILQQYVYLRLRTPKAFSPTPGPNLKKLKVSSLIMKSNIISTRTLSYVNFSSGWCSFFLYLLPFGCSFFVLYFLFLRSFFCDLYFLVRKFCVNALFTPVFFFFFFTSLKKIY